MTVTAVKIQFSHKNTKAAQSIFWLSCFSIILLAYHCYVITLQQPQTQLFPDRKRKNPNPVKSSDLNFGSPSWTRTSDIVINSHALYRLSYWGISRNRKEFRLRRCRHLSIFPGRHQPSIFDVYELNFCVRNGNRWNLIAINTDYLIKGNQP